MLGLTRLHLLIAVMSTATILLILFALYYFGHIRTQTIVATAESQFSENHFLLNSGDRPIGYLWTNSQRAPDREFVFENRHSYPLSPTVTYQTEVSYQFESESPYRLTEAVYRRSISNDDSAELTVTLYRNDDNLVFSDSENNTTPLNHEFSLMDLLHLEHWLHTDSPQIGEEIVRLSINWDKRRLDKTTWRVLGFSDRALQLESGDGNVVSEYEREPDVNLVRSIDFANDRSIELTHDIDFDAIAKSTFSIGGFIPVIGAITNPQQLSALTLRFDFKGRTPSTWQQILDKNNRVTVRAEVKPGNMNPDQTLSLEPLERTPELDFVYAALVRLAAVETTEVKAAALLDFVHERVRYVDLNKSQGLHETINSRKGDCSDIAELYTVLANTLGIPARTVVGLVYDNTNNAFRVHAWNEVAIDGQLRQLDPSWLQHQADATHIELPPGSEFEILGALSELTIYVEDQSHASI